MPSTPDGNHVTKAELQELKSELLAQFKELREYIDERTTNLHEYIDERTHDAETRLLRAFGDYQQAQTTRFRHMKADLGNLNTAQ